MELFVLDSKMLTMLSNDMIGNDDLIQKMIFHLNHWKKKDSPLSEGGGGRRVRGAEFSPAPPFGRSVMATEPPDASLQITEWPKSASYNSILLVYGSIWEWWLSCLSREARGSVKITSKME